MHHHRISISFSSVPAPKPLTKAQKKNTNRKLKKELGFYSSGVVRAFPCKAVEVGSFPLFV